MENPSYQEYLRKQREENHKYMRKYLPSIQSEEDLYFNNMD